MNRVMALMIIGTWPLAAAAAPNLSVESTPYLQGGLFTNPVLPQEDTPVTITVRARWTGDLAADPPARLTVANRDGAVVLDEVLTLARDGDRAQAQVPWASSENGLFTVRVVLDPENVIEEDNEDDNAAKIVLPVIVKGKGRDLHFPWYSESPFLRWSTCITSAGKDPAGRARLVERGVLPLNWEYGGMSWSYYNKERAASDPEAELADLEELFYKKYTSDADVYGFGIDEVGGYPGSWKFKASVASLKGLVRARPEQPDRFYVVWSGGGLRPEIASLCRQGANLLLLETYLWRALPDELGAQDVYEALVARAEPFIRATDMFQPAYGNQCYTLFGLDTSERPDRTDLGELEQVVRFIRRRFPEMRGIAWYTGGYGQYGLVRTQETDRHHEAVRRKADDLCLQYWVKPCITLMQESLWLTGRHDGTMALTLAVSNIGSVDSNAVAVEFLMDGEPVATRAVSSVPAGPGRIESMVQVDCPVAPSAGTHRFEARIVSAPGSTVLVPAAVLDRYIPEGE
ncbi:MAG: hypothetical protein GY851_06530 [bacterium]|nr:hypothetical protein [bacterium]